MALFHMCADVCKECMEMLWCSFDFPVYSTVSRPGNNQFTIEVIVSNLKPVTSYQFRVAAATAHNGQQQFGDYTEYVEQTTSSSGKEFHTTAEFLFQSKTLFSFEKISPKKVLIYTKKSGFDKIEPSMLKW